MIPGGYRTPQRVPTSTAFQSAYTCDRHELVIDPHERLAPAISFIRASTGLLFTTVSRFSVTVTNYCNNFYGIQVNSNSSQRWMKWITRSKKDVKMERVCERSRVADPDCRGNDLPIAYSSYI